MELGQRLRQARQEAGLSQRQLCGEVITRNMLSQIENGSAHPSMETLRYLAGQLGKPVSYFLEEDTVVSSGQAHMNKARQAYETGDFAGVLTVLENTPPSGGNEWERGLLLALAGLALAEQALREGRQPYAVTLLERAGQAGSASPYYTPELERRRLLLLAQAKPGESIAVSQRLPKDDRELRLRARAALDMGLPQRSAALLEAAEDRDNPDWNLLRGETWLAETDYTQAAACFRKAEDAYPRIAAPRLEQCYRELGDYQMAYFYACKQRQWGG